jgi:hypothetical protein
MDDQNVVHFIRHLSPDLNNKIGLKDDNVTPVLPGTTVLSRRRDTMRDFTLIGNPNFADGAPGTTNWTAADFYSDGTSPGGF